MEMRHGRLPWFLGMALAITCGSSDAEIVELALGVGLFMGMSKVLICLGLEPEEMQTTVVPTPGGG